MVFRPKGQAAAGDSCDRLRGSRLNEQTPPPGSERHRGMHLAGTSDARAQYWSPYRSWWGDHTFRQKYQRGYKKPDLTKKAQPQADSKGASKDTAKGPLLVIISIADQRISLYDNGALVARSSVSTGVKNHPTPLGVFSVISKSRWHRSNIYSGAPMPYMQRITWSGVAMHAGVLPGYPASHGCIRMPTAFAMKMWNWTRMGARVIITPGQITPASFSHPLLVAQKVVPQPLIANDPATDAPAVKSDKGADASHATKPANSEAGLDLRSTVGHAAPLREQTHTADASSALPKGVVTMSDAAPSAATIQPASDTPAAEVKSTEAEDKPGDAKVEAKSETKSDELNTEAPTAAIAGTEPAKAEPTKAEAPKVEEAKPIVVVKAEALARQPENAGALAFKRTGDPNMGQFGDAQVLRTFGKVPENLDEL